MQITDELDEELDDELLDDELLDELQMYSQQVQQSNSSNSVRIFSQPGGNSNARLVFASCQ